MKYYFVIILFVTELNSSPRKKETTPDVHLRVLLLKQKIAEEIRLNQRAAVTPVDEDFAGEYVDLESQPITPIMSYDERKKKGKFKLRQLKTIEPVQRVPDKIKAPKPTRKKIARKRKLKSKAIDIFYRRLIESEMMDEPSEWTHCQDLITPFLTGLKTDISSTKRVTADDPVVVRLVQLLQVNTTGQSKEDIYSIMYQISNLQLRLFQWDVSALRLLFKTLIKEKSHSFTGLKHGLKNIFAKWSLDISNTTNLLKQSRIFRPPCVTITGYEGSTKTSSGMKYTKPQKKPGDVDDSDCKDP